MTAGFLEPLVRRGGVDLALINATRGTTVAARVEAALDSRSRNRGLLRRDGLLEGQALVLAPCSSVHTFFMRFSLDVLFVARDGRVRRAKRAVPPWRIALAPGSFVVVEAAPGTVDRSGTQPGDYLELRRPEAV